MEALPERRAPASGRPRTIVDPSDPARRVQRLDVDFVDGAGTECLQLEAWLERQYEAARGDDFDAGPVAIVANG